MRGTRNSLGGFPVRSKESGRHATHFRYYRVTHTSDYCRITNLWYEFGETGFTVRTPYVFLNDGYGNNAITESGVSSSTYGATPSTGTWGVDIDCKNRRKFTQFGVLSSYMSRGWRLLASNDKRQWVELCRITPQYAKTTWPWYHSSNTFYPKWHVIDIATSKVPASGNGKHLYWGIVAGPTYNTIATIYAATSSSQIAEIEFNDTVGGTDLCTGGTVVNGPCDTGPLSPTQFFDDNTTVYNYINPGVSIAYKFVEPVAPKEMTIHSGVTVATTAANLCVVYADNEYDWQVHKKLDTFGDWPDERTVAYPL